MRHGPEVDLDRSSTDLLSQTSRRHRPFPLRAPPIQIHSESPITDRASPRAVGPAEKISQHPRQDSNLRHPASKSAGHPEPGNRGSHTSENVVVTAPLNETVARDRCPAWPLPAVRGLRWERPAASRDDAHSRRHRTCGRAWADPTGMRSGHARGGRSTRDLRRRAAFDPFVEYGSRPTAAATVTPVECQHEASRQRRRLPARDGARSAAHRGVEFSRRS